ncbi:MAG TPA: NUDIX domain-containing protein [Nostocaceae cyanobacterium]|nr:NUDIX domain-containing protein [Nostocaceae cyanobacterium]
MPIRERAYYEAVENKTTFIVERNYALKLITLMHIYPPVNPEKILESLAPPNTERYKLPSGNANLGEIEIVSQSEDNLIKENLHSPVNKYVAVYVDDVRFFQKDKSTGKTVIADGKYICITPPNNKNGAIVLPVDKNTGDILLVTQYRHPQRRFLTEAPRGFASIRDNIEIDTAKRELEEETAAKPLPIYDSLDYNREEIYPLKALFTDTGKLSEQPAYFLAFVDRKLQFEKLKQRNPVMEDPVWVTLPKFYQAVYSKKPVQLLKTECEFAFSSDQRSYLRGGTPVDQGVLEVLDAFTTVVALLAFPYIAKALRGKVNIEDKWFNTETYISDNH